MFLKLRKKVSQSVSHTFSILENAGELLFPQLRENQAPHCRPLLLRLERGDEVLYFWEG